MQELLLLHGAIGSKRQFENLTQHLKENFSVHTLNFSGHGDAAFAEVFSIPQFADEVSDYLQTNEIDTINIFGYSMGGLVALYFANKHPDKIHKVFTLGTKFHWTPAIAQHEIKMLDADKITEKIPAFAQTLQQRHGLNNWKKLLQKTAEMMLDLGNNVLLEVHDFQNIKVPVSINIGEKDSMVTLEETVEVYKSLPNAMLNILPDTPHPIEKVNEEKLALDIKKFFF